MKPAGIVVDVDTRQMQINWEDGHTSIYDLTYLRRACPCAQCQPWKEGIGREGESPESVLRATGELESASAVTPIGNYAICFHWADGHAFGIYDFGYLRDLCPCEECASKRAAAPNRPN